MPRLSGFFNKGGIEFFFNSPALQPSLLVSSSLWEKTTITATISICDDDDDDHFDEDLPSRKTTATVATQKYKENREGSKPTR